MVRYIDEKFSRPRLQLKRTDQTLQQRPYLAGEALNLADPFLVPSCSGSRKHPRVGLGFPRFQHRAAGGERQSFQETAPPMAG